jgi:exonuclease SbcC
LHIINARKQHCYAKAILNINSESYVVERQTVKNENKKGINASTHLNVFRYNNESKRFDDLAGEGRTDTEKVLRGLIGSSEDFLLTTMSVQNENNQFLGHGSAKRKQTLFRFLDLEIFDTMHDFAKSEMNILKSNLKNFSVVVDYDKLIYDLKDNLSKASIQVSSISDSLQKLQSELFDVESTIKVLNSSADVKDVDVISLKNVINDISNSINSQNIVLKSKQLELQKLNSTLSETVVSDDELTMLKQGVEQYEALKSTTSLHKNKLDQLSNTLKQHRNSLQLLNSVPCGDSFPECKFIHNAHLDKNNIVTTTNEFEEVKALFEQSHNLMLKMAEFQYDLKLSDRLKKIAVHNQTKSNITLAEKFVENTELQIQNLQLRLKQSEEKYEKIKSHNESEFHAKLKACTDERDRILKDIKSKDALRIKLAEDIGRMNSTLCSMIEEKNLKESLVNKLKIYELAVVAFSKKGIPSLIVESQLPIINEEISKILHGIVDFTVSLELDKESDSLEIYIDYFDSKRLIELGSGMEKMIASVAIRVALTNVSTLPKTDMFVIDEGFGALDEMSVEACNRFLVSLKRYFKTILLITHVDGVKDIVDSMIEIVKSEKDSKVLYE